MIAGSTYIGRYPASSSGMQLSDLINSGDTVNEAISRLTTMLATLISEHDITQAALASEFGATGTIKTAITN